MDRTLAMAGLRDRLRELGRRLGEVLDDLVPADSGRQPVAVPVPVDVEPRRPRGAEEARR